MLTPQRELLAVTPATTNRSKKQAGYALLEIMLAFAVGAIIITGMVSLGVVSVRGLTASRASSEAGKIAQREVDRLKLLRSSSTTWTGFTGAVGSCTQCYLSPSGGSFNVISSVGIENLVTYYFSVSTPASDRINYTVTAGWNVGPVSKSYIIEGAFTNWENK